MAAKIAEQLKERGNAHFKLAEYDSAILCYSQAITKNPDNAVFFTNRANAKLKIKDWSGAMDDCIRSITLSRNNLKAFWHLAVAQLELNHPSEALTSAMTAYDLCSNSTQQTSSAFHISAFVLKCKKAKWDMREADRLRRRSELLWKCEVYLENETAKEVQDVETRFRNMEIGQVGRSEELDEIKKNGRDKVDELRTVFALANPGLMEKRVSRSPPTIAVDQMNTADTSIRRYRSISSTTFPSRSCMIL